MSAKTSAWQGLLKQPLVWGGLLTASYYAVILQPHFAETSLRAYTAEHLSEYVIVTLLFWATAHLTLRLLGLGGEWRAAQGHWLPEATQPQRPDEADDMLALLDAAPAAWQNTRIASRFRRALTFVAARNSADGFREYLHDLAEEDADETSSNYAFPRFVSALAPVLGLLGTVVHFGVALGGLGKSGNFVEMLPGMLAHIGTAFNTTCVALTVSMVTLFYLFWVERREELLIRWINERAELELLNRFTTVSESLTPFLDALAAAQDVTIQSLQTLQAEQLAKWQAQLETGRTEWLAATGEQKSQFAAFLTETQKRELAQLEQVQESINRLAALNDATAQTAELLGGEKQIIRLQQKLTENLELLHRSQKFEDALHGLTAAIHLLTARQTSTKKAA